MKKKHYLLGLAVFLLGTTSSFAQSEELVNDYTFNFDDYEAIGEIDEETSSYYTSYVHDFAPAGWGHIVDFAKALYSYSSDFYVTYSFSANGGVNNSGALSGSSQESYSGDKLNDLLVTPLVNGKVTLKAKKGSSYSYNDQDVKFYKVTYANGTYTAGDEISPDEAVSLGSDFSTITLTLSEPTYIGIRINSAIIDDFTAAQATIAKRPGLSINTIKNLNGKYNDAGADNNVTLKYDVPLSNIGLVDLTPGYENYSLSLTRGENGDTIVTFPIDKTIAVGAADTVHFVESVPFETLGSTPFEGWIKENITGKTRSVGTITPVPYNPVLNVTGVGSSDSITGSYRLGESQQAIVKDFVLHNDGGSALNISSINVTAPFTVNRQAPITIEPHATDTLSVTLPNNAPGDYNGTLTINNNAANYTLALTGTIVDSTAWFVNFEDMSPNSISYPKGTYAEMADGAVQPDWQSYSVESVLGYTDNKVALQNNSTQRQTKYISPLLEFKDGDVLSFDAARRETSASYPSNNSVLKVYYSTNRKDWALAYTIAADESTEADARFSSEYKMSGSSYWATPVYEFTHYTVNNIPAGKYYIGFESGYANLDNILGGKVADVAHDIEIKNTNIPAKGEVNYNLSATASVNNKNVKDEAAGSYTAKLYFDDEVVGEAEATAIESNATVNYTFNVTPHKEGTFKAYVKIAFNDGTEYTSDTTNVTIAAEQFRADKQIGQNNTTTSAPIKPYDKNSEGAVIYPADLLGLSAGTKISSITLKGSVQRDIDLNLRFYIGNTTKSSITIGDNFSLEDVADTASLTKVYNGKYSLSSSTGELTIQLPEPFVYDGTNLVIAAKHSADAYSRFDIQADSNYPSNGVVHSSDYTLSTAAWSTATLPVLYLGLIADAPVLSGTVTSGGTAVANVPVVLTSGNIVYSDTTDADGNYSIPVLQISNKYNLTANVSGYEPYTEKDLSIAENTTKDITLNPATGLFIQESNVPATGSVNSVYTATATVLNDISSDIAAGDYTAQLFFDGKAVSEPQTVDVAAGKTADFSFTFTPHAEGTFPAVVKFVYNGNTYSTQSVNVTVSPESFGGLYTAGDSTEVSVQSYQVPWDNWYKQCESEILYPKEAIGLEDGAVIKAIKFRGRFSENGEGDETVRMYIENTTDDSYQGYTLTPRDTTEMTKVLDGTIHYQKTVPDNSVIDVISVDIPDGFIYTGGSIRVSFAGNHLGQADNKVFFVIDRNYRKNSWNRHIDSGEISEQSFQTISELPVMYMTVESFNKASGTVKSDKDQSPVAGATVTLVGDNDVRYTATTAEDGSYSLNVGKTDLTYDAIVTAEGFKTDTIHGVSLADGDIVLDFDLQALNQAGISTINVNNGNGIGDLTTADVRVYSLSGAKIAEGKGAVTRLERGTYIVRDKRGNAKTIIVK